MPTWIDRTAVLASSLSEISQSGLSIDIAARALVGEAAEAELFLHPGDRHLFADSSLSSYDADATALLTRRVLAFLGAR